MYGLLCVCAGSLLRITPRKRGTCNPSSTPSVKSTSSSAAVRRSRTIRGSDCAVSLAPQGLQRKGSVRGKWVGQTGISWPLERIYVVRKAMQYFNTHDQ